jgi:hypothetical protein
MKPQTITIAVAAFVLGFVVHFIVSKINLVYHNSDVVRHWKLVHDYNAFMRNPKNYSADPSGLYGAEDPYDPEPSLAALVAAGELEHIDIVLPKVPSNRGTNQHWMQFVDKRHDTIIFAIGNQEYVDYKPSGEPPLHLNLWFKASAKADVQRLITELEELESVAATTDR